MKVSHQQTGTTRTDDASENSRSNMVRHQTPLPGRNREELIRQFQQIDGSTRPDAEQQIDAYEQSFLGIPPRSGITGK